MLNQSQNGLQSEPKLSPLQLQRIDFLNPIYGTAGVAIVRNVSGKGRKSWASFVEKMNIVLKANPGIRAYFDALYEAFELNQVYSKGQIIGIVNEVRREMGLEPHYQRIKIQSEYDFNLLFLIEDVYEEEMPIGGGSPLMVFKGYRPLAKVKPE